MECGRHYIIADAGMRGAKVPQCERSQQPERQSHGSIYPGYLGSKLIDSRTMATPGFVIEAGRMIGILK
jgi:hypothetical protein